MYSPATEAKAFSAWGRLLYPASIVVRLRSTRRQKLDTIAATLAASWFARSPLGGFLQSRNPIVGPQAAVALSRTSLPSSTAWGDFLV